MAAEAELGVGIVAVSPSSAAFTIPRSPSPCNVPIAAVSVDTAAPSASANSPTAKDAVVFTAASGATSGSTVSARCSSNGVESFSSGTEILGVVEEEDGLLLGLFFFSFFFFETTAVARVVAARRYQMIKSSNVTRAESSGDKS
jgi:hypothetical protein